MDGLWDKLAKTWPARAAQSLWEGLTLPGDVYAGNVSMPGLGLRREDYTDIPTPSKGAARGTPGLLPDAWAAPVAEQPGDLVYNRAADLAGALMGGSMPAAQRGAAGVFGGRLAHGFDAERAAAAESLLKGGARPGDVWADTQMFKGPDGAMRFEIPDAPAKLTGRPFVEDRVLFGEQSYKPQQLSEAIDHPELFKAYPQLADTQVFHAPGEKGAQFVHSEPPSIRLDMNGPDARNYLLHETQHNVQAIEGFSPGAMPGHTGFMHGLPDKLAAHPAVSEAEGLFAQLLRERALATQAAEREVPWEAVKMTARERKRDPIRAAMIDDANALGAPRREFDQKALDAIDADFGPRIAAAEDAANKARYQAYRSAAGEVEARNVEGRSMMGHNSRRGIAPWESADTPLSNQHVLPGRAPGTAFSAPAGALGSGPVLRGIGKTGIVEGAENSLSKAPSNFNLRTADLPLPLSIKDRSWQNYGKGMNADDVLSSESVWGNMDRHAAALGISRHEAFADLANDLWGRMNANRYIDAAAAKRYIGQETAKLNGIGIVPSDGPVSLNDILKKYGIAGLPAGASLSAGLFGKDGEGPY